MAGQFLQGIVLEFGMSIHGIPNSREGEEKWVGGDARFCEVFGNGSEKFEQPERGREVGVNSHLHDFGGSRNSRRGGEAVRGEGRARRCRWDRGVGEGRGRVGVTGCCRGKVRE